MAILTVEGLVERLTYHNEDTGYVVLKAKIKGYSDTIPIVGHTQNISVGEHFKAEGVWSFHKEHGRQFKAERIVCFPPHTIEGIEKYLGSGLIKGIGPVYANRMVERYGEKVFTVIETTPRKLESIPGFGKKRVEKIKKGWDEQKKVREIMLFLHENGVSTGRAVRIYKTYGDDAIGILQKNPYRLAKDIHGIGFISADKIAQNMGIAKEAETRLGAGLQHTLFIAQNDGHCGLPMKFLLKESEKILEVSEVMLQQKLQKELASAELILEHIRNEEVVFLPAFHYMEQYIGESLGKRAQKNAPFVIDLERSIAWAEKKANIALSKSQQEALRNSLSSQVSIITGGPGVGKTTLVRCLLEILIHKVSRIKLAAPTGRAAKRLAESTGMDTTTLHRLLEPGFGQGGFQKNAENLLDCDCLIVDEVSMVDVSLMYALLKALPAESMVIFVGDIDQLPSVGPGNILGDMIASQTITTSRLREIFRQGTESLIIANAHRINQGHMPLIPNREEDDFFFVETLSPEEGLSKLLSIISDRIPKRWGANPMTDIQVLSPMNRGILGSRSLNLELQKRLNQTPEKPLHVFGQAFNIGDKVIQTQNDYEKDIYNGDIGFIQKINFEIREVGILFGGKNIVFDFGEMDTLYLAYCITIHKAQGSEFPFVVMPVSMSHYLMLQRNLIYTGVTRAKSKVILVGEKKALYLAINQSTGKLRWTNLQKWL